jgi:hypothetical protein
MRRRFILATLFAAVVTSISLAQQDRLQGLWQGKVQAPQGELQATVIFRKEGDSYSGSVTGLRGNAQVALKDVKIEGDTVSAQSLIESPQGSFVVNYKFTLQGETMKGKGELDFGGQSFSFDFDLKRTGDAPPPGAAIQQPAGPAGQNRPQTPQPQQRQSLDYFVGQWSFKWVGRESAIGPGGAIEGITTFKKASANTLEAVTEARTDEGSFRETATIGWDDAQKMFTFDQRRSNGVQILSKGDWSRPIAIHFTVQPIKVKGQTLQLKRTISVISAFSFAITEELSEDGGPFVRLGSAVYSKAGAPPSVK